MKRANVQMVHSFFSSQFFAAIVVQTKPKKCCEMSTRRAFPKTMVNLMIQVVLYSLKHCFGMSFWLDDLLCAGFDCICKKREKNLEYTDT